MNRIVMIAIAWVGLMGVAAAATGAQSSSKSSRSNDCMFSSQLRNWTVLDDQQLVIWGTGSRDAYLVKLFAPEREFRFATTLAVIDQDRNGMICGDGGDRLTVPGSPTMMMPAIISSMRHVDDVELAALSEQYKVKLLPAKKLEELKQRDKQAH